MNNKSHIINKWQHNHNFASVSNAGERNTRYVLYLTLVTMIVEIVAGTIYGSMALLADGWHMGTHAAAFMITLFAYWYARKHADNPAFSFGTGKVSVLGGFTSAIALGLVALIMLIESLIRVFNPHAIQFNEAILVAIIGLTVNVISVFLLKDHHSHSHDHGHSHEHSHSHDKSSGDTHDHNLKAAYFHVLADALTSILAIAALVMGKLYGLNWLDPIMGIVGAIIITKWAWQLLKQTAPILLDGSIESDYKQEIISEIESDDEHHIADIHVWRVSADHFAAEISILAGNPRETAYYRKKLKHFCRLSHLTIEVNRLTQAEYSH
ncbi:CDF family Co(II)/Ni(II) efflux transporter DmeF [Shewanella eurypsychrophilus]|uniref:CDF family Co(II)/Ni(II) efflux transporter DmeF n=1 Tax=Shewanella eurypsychrophilus TaxID=2593656 RepID=A0ABX6V5P6_9GAMM|nr:MULTISPECIES: CDF family Co(II)/Ni(II) efflux transporter DmeF [Shewanella]QFU22678.1 CDF family Co(II)/Ni(II) efflux transporter DmeF [Shewanella sp. YLB-09]QPG57967.1 CDF family Co(II)/Ni(II) efflux transporter DmeF [Shewanella eurypsychrophilus]